MTFPAEILRKPAANVSKISARQRELLADMTDTLYKDEHTVGVAAQQVNLDERLVVIDARDKHGLLKLINPEIISREGRSIEEEGCLSLPGITVKVPRAEKVTVKAKNERGEEITLEADGFLARVLQHEIDHLNGRMIVDYLSPAAKFLARLKYLISRCFKKKQQG